MAGPHPGRVEDPAVAEAEPARSVRAAASRFIRRLPRSWAGPDRGRSCRGHGRGERSRRDRRPDRAARRTLVSGSLPSRSSVAQTPTDGNAARSRHPGAAEKHSCYGRRPHRRDAGDRAWTPSPPPTRKRSRGCCSSAPRRWRRRWPSAWPRTATLRRVPDRSIADLVQADLLKAARPARHGGFELDLDAVIEIISALGRGCGSTAWVFGIFCDHAITMGMMPEEAQDDIWSEDPEALVCSGLMPAGRAERVAGGFRLSGRWQFSSGCDHAAWAFVQSATPPDGEGAAPTPAYFLLPAPGLRDRRYLVRVRAGRHRQQGHRGRGRVRARPPRPAGGAVQRGHGAGRAG